MARNILISMFSHFATKNEVISDNGIVLDTMCISATTKEDFCNYTLDAQFLVNDVTKQIDKETILKVKLDYGDEIFRVCKVEKSQNRIIVVAQQITIRDLISCYLLDVRPTNATSYAFLSHIYNNSDNGNRFKDITFTTDLAGEGTSYFVKKNVYEAIWDSDNSFVNTFGGETKRRAYNVSINAKQGADNGVLIAEGKNIKGFAGTSHLDDLCTRGIGQGYDGILGDFVESPLIDSYANVYTKVFEYNYRLKVEDEELDSAYVYFDTETELKQALNEAVAKEFSDNEVDKPKTQYSINFMALEKTEQYKNYIQAERLDLGDTVRVYVKKLDTNIQTRIVSKNYNVMCQRTTEMKLSNYADTQALSTNQLLNTLKKQLGQSNSANVGEYISAIMNAGLKNSNVIVRENEIVIGDTRDINTMRNVWRFNAGGLAHSSEGYYSKNWNIGITQDGTIVADRILTGVLTAIMIQNKDASFQIDLGGTGGATFLNNGIKAMEIKNNKFRMYDWKEEGREIGYFGSIRYVNIPYPTMTWSSLDSILTISYDQIRDGDTKTVHYIRFDKDLKFNTHSPIEFQERATFFDGLNVGRISAHNTDKTIYIQDSDLEVRGTIRGGANKSIRAMAVDVNSIQAEDGVEIWDLDGINRLYPTNEGSTEVVTQARRLIGLPYSQDYFNYLTNQLPPHVDCSSLCQWSYYQIGKTISRTTYTQINEGVEVELDKLVEGDLVFSNFSAPNVPEHVFLYSGYRDGKHWCVEAQTFGTYVLERSFAPNPATMRARRVVNTNNASTGYVTIEQYNVLRDEVEELKSIINKGDI